MALQAYLDNYLLALSSLDSSQVTPDLVKSSNSENILQRGQIHAALGCCSNASSGKFPVSLIKIPDLNVAEVSEDREKTILNSITNLESSLAASFLATGSNSAVPKGPQLQGSASTDTDHLDLSTFPLLMSPNLSNFGSSTACYSIAEEDVHLGQNRLQIQKRKRQQGDIRTISLHKKIRLDNQKNAILQENIIQQLLPSQDSVQLQAALPALHALVPQNKLGNQKQQDTLQSTLQLLGVNMKQQQQRQMRDYLQSLALPRVQSMLSFNANVCSRRLMQYMYHQRQRPPDSGISYWRKFVAEYFAPCAKKRWCLSSCDSARLHAIGVFSQGTWHCDLCRTKSGRGFEATFEVLPRLNNIQFDSGVINELLFLECPLEFTLPSGLMVLEYGKVVHETLYDQLHVVREGKLRIIFAHNLKIILWEFCSRDHEELIPRSSILPKVNELVHASKNYQTNIDDIGSYSTPLCDLQENCTMLLSAGRELERDLGLQLVGDLGFSKRYVRCLQIADILNCMKDLMTFSWDNQIGPIESLKKYTQQFSTTKLHKDELQEKEQLEVLQGLPTDPNKLSASHALGGNSNDNSNMSKGALLNISDVSCHCIYPSQTCINSNVGELEQTSLSYKRCGRCRNASSTPSQGPKTLSAEVIQEFAFPGLHSSGGGQHRREHKVQNLLEEIIIRAENEAVNAKIGNIISGLQTGAKGKTLLRMG
uniref:SEUSS-like 2 n=1 Tax=Populus tomentosa TaxID=118781 RepID=A0A1I9W005_POPTO|nr:SEUSS-like 2 [Populus tomentosa]